MYSGTIVPIGEDPDGVVWTGFASVAKEGSQAYLLAFRELSEQSDWTLQVPLAHGSFRSVTTLAGGGTAHLDGDRVAVHIPEKLGYVWVRLN